MKVTVGCSCLREVLKQTVIFKTRVKPVKVLMLMLMMLMQLLIIECGELCEETTEIIIISRRYHL